MAGRPVTASSHVALSSGPTGRSVAEADGRAAQASRFGFAVGPGEYRLEATASGSARYAAWITVGAGARVTSGAAHEFVVDLGPVDDQVEESGGEGSRIAERIAAFARL